MKEKVFGVYGGLIDKDEVLLVNDIDIAKRMLIKDFDHFMDRTNLGLKFDHSKLGDRIFANMFIVQKGDIWKTQRSLMSPAFTTGKLKLMYPLLLKVRYLKEKPKIRSFLSVYSILVNNWRNMFLNVQTRI